MKKLVLLLFTVLSFAVISCTATKSGGGAEANKTSMDKRAEESQQTSQNIPLEDYLRRIPGLRVTGKGSAAKVRIASIGKTSATGSQSPLFVIDGVRIGNNLSDASNVVQTSDIKKVKVLKDPSQTSFYGSAGAAGVIEIMTKKGK
jgi:TonB-dependent SusC/RagA subfamily outer membrane receptor